MASTKRALTLAMAFWLVISPIILGYEADPPAVQNGLWVAVVVASLAIAEGLVTQLSVLHAALGAWLAIAPLLLGYGTSVARINHLAAGIVLVALTPTSRRWRERQAHETESDELHLPQRQLRGPS